jgi:transcription elongation factor Elf1
METEHFFTCPYCLEEISMVIELGAGGQRYIEDCEVCCRPVSISYETDGSEVLSFEAHGADE